MAYLNRASWSGGKGTSAEVPAITSSSFGHSGFNMVSVWPPGPSSPVPVRRGGIVGLSDSSNLCNTPVRILSPSSSDAVYSHYISQETISPTEVLERDETALKHPLLENCEEIEEEESGQKRHNENDYGIINIVSRLTKFRKHLMDKSVGK
ncbi:hypothetical protein YC2023_041416 [Brassica napus]